MRISLEKGDLKSDLRWSKKALYRVISWLVLRQVKGLDLVDFFNKKNKLK